MKLGEGKTEREMRGGREKEGGGGGEGGESLHPLIKFQLPLLLHHSPSPSPFQLRTTIPLPSSPPPYTTLSGKVGERGRGQSSKRDGWFESGGGKSDPDLHRRQLDCF